MTREKNLLVTFCFATGRSLTNNVLNLIYKRGNVKGETYTNVGYIESSIHSNPIFKNDPFVLPSMPAGALFYKTREAFSNFSRRFSFHCLISLVQRGRVAFRIIHFALLEIVLQNT